jgi:hypothetical protein
MHICDEVTTNITDKGISVETPPRLLKNALETIYTPRTFVKFFFRIFQNKASEHHEGARRRRVFSCWLLVVGRWSLVSGDCRNRLRCLIGR